MVVSLATGGRGSRSAKCGGCVGDAGVVVDPVGFPGFAAVVGEGLLAAHRIAREIREGEAHQDRAAVPHGSAFCGAVVLDPLIGVGEGMSEAAEVGVPGAEFEIEVVGGVAGCGGCGGGLCIRAWRCGE